MRNCSKYFIVIILISKKSKNLKNYKLRKRVMNKSSRRLDHIKPYKTNLAFLKTKLFYKIDSRFVQGQVNDLVESNKLRSVFSLRKPII